MDIAIALAAGNTVGEGPVWDVAEQRLYWVDMLNPAVWSCRDDGGDVRTWRLAEEVGAVALRAKGWRGHRRAPRFRVPRLAKRGHAHDRGPRG
jgi:sugar lactone lactonase YvrE